MNTFRSYIGQSANPLLQTQTPERFHRPVLSNLYSFSRLLTFLTTASSQVQLVCVGTRRASSQHLWSASQPRTLVNHFQFLVVTSDLKYRVARFVPSVFSTPSEHLAAFQPGVAIDQRISPLSSVMSVTSTFSLLYNTNPAIRRRHICHKQIGFPPLTQAAGSVTSWDIPPGISPRKHFSFHDTSLLHSCSPMS